MSDRPPAPSAAVSAGSESLFDDELDAPTTVDASAFQSPSVPDYPSIGNFGPYEILGKIAMGGMAEIFLARDRMEDGGVRHLVIKRVLPHMADNDSFIAMFLDEARIANRLYHPNVAHVYESGEINDAYFMAMEWVHGPPLRRVIRRAYENGAGIEAAVGVKIISLMAEALHYAHNAQGEGGRPLYIVHRDVSPHNIMISWTGGVKLLDFGIAKASSQHAQTQAGQVKGKYSYMSPEQCRSSEDIDHRSDIFALGICLYEVLTGHPLYHHDTVLNTMQAIVYGDVPSVREQDPTLPHELDRIVQKALAKDPAHRFQTAAELHDALERFLAMRQEWVDPGRISAFLDTLFDEEDKMPLRPPSRQTGSFPGLTPSGSGSFGPFGSRPRQMEPVERLDVRDSMPKPSSITTARVAASDVEPPVRWVPWAIAAAATAIAVGAVLAWVL